MYLKLQEIEKILISVKAKEIDDNDENSFRDNKSDNEENNLE